VEYASQYVSIVSLGEAQRLFLDTFSRLSKSVTWFWASGALGLLFLVFQIKKMENAGVILLFVLSSVQYLVYVDSPFSWLTNPNAAQDIFRWYQRYKTNFKLVGIVDMNPSLKATYVWREQIEGYKGQGKNRVWVWERK
jgi:uncharacterized membrane protein YdcZ (DUF606 family)